MTLDASGPVVFAEARPPSDRVRGPETRQGAPDLGALEALIADPASVSSEEATPAGFIVETPIQDEADADGNGTGEARPEDALAESVSEFAESPTHALQESADPERIADDSPAVHLPLTHETPDVPIEHGARHAEPTDLDDAAGAAAGGGDPARDRADAGNWPAAPSAGDIVERDTSAADTSAADTSAAGTSAEDTGVPNKGIETSPGADRPQAAIDPSGNVHGDRSGGAGTDGSDRTAAAKTANAAASLDDTLLRDIAEAPAVSSDLIVSGETDAAGLAVDAPLFQDPHPETGGDAPRSRALEPLFGAASRGPEAAEAVDTAEGAFAQLQAPDAGTDRSIGKARPDESPSAGQGGTSTNAEVGSAAAVAQGVGSGSGTNDTTLPGSVEAGVRAASPVDESSETGDEASGDRSDRDAQASVDEAAALLAHTLLREIADSAAVSSDSVSSDRADAADLAATSTDRDIRQAAGVDSLTDREFDPPLTVDSRHVGVPVAADARAKTLERLESPKPEVGQFVDDLDQTESLAPAGMAADTDGVATGDDAEPVYRLRDLGGSPPSGTDAGHGESAMRRVADAVAASAAEPAISAETDFQEIDAAPSGDAGLLEQSDAAGGNAARSEGAGEIALPETDGTRQETAEAAHERLDRRGDTPAEAPSPARPTVPEAESPLDPADADEPVNVTATEDPGQGDMESEDGSVTVIHLPDLSGPLPSRTDAGHDEALLRQIADVVAASAGEATDSAGANLPGRSAAPAHGSASVPEQGDPGAGDVPRSEDADAIVPTEPESSERCSAPIVPERLDSPGDSRGEAPPFPDSDEPTPESPGGDTGPVAATIARTPEGAGDSTAAPAASESADPFDRTSLDKTAAAAPTEYLDHLESEPDDGAVSVIHLPDLSRTEPPGTAGSHDGSPPRQTADAEAASAGEPAGPPEAASPESEDERPHGIAAASQVEDAPSRDDASPEYASAEVLTESVEAQAPAVPTQVERDEEHGGLAPAGAIGPDASAAAPGIEFDDTLVLELDGVSPVSSGETGAPDSTLEALGRSAGPDTRSPSAPEPAFDVSLPDAGPALSGASRPEPADEYADIALETETPGPAAALAFATDAETEVALRDGLFGFGSASAGTGEAQVWQGGLRAAIAALAEGRTAPLVFVDIDGVPYPAGAIHELAAVCEVGTVVVAVGSDVSARPGRELLLSGVSDYLAKPLTAEAVRGVASRALGDEAGSGSGGRVACFVGCGGSGATTLAAAAALQAASRGCYVSVLDLSRSVAAAALALGVEPVAGLDQLLETADRIPVEPESLDGVCGRRSDRIEVYAHRWSPEHPAAATAAAVDRLLAALRQRSQLVLLDGLDEAGTRFLPCAEVDTRVFVAEPTADKTPHLVRTIDLLDAGRPLVFVRNYTRAFRRNGSGQALREAGIGIDPDVTIPFDPSVPETSDRGWPQGTLPRSLRKPVAALTDRLLEASAGSGAMAALTARAA